jgi:thioredoxin reductase
MSNQAEQLVVVGAGAAGCAAALEAVRLGLRVTLVDEHPQSTAAMGFDAPYFYGTRLAPALSDASATAERVLGANDSLMECLEAGVEVLTGNCVWGIFVPGENSRHLGSRQLGLADETKSWMVAFEYLILAPGARDLVLSFPGWHLPGVLGVQAGSRLLGHYQALGGRRVLVLGSGNAALSFAKLALDTGIEVAGVVEPGASIQGAATLARQIQDAGVSFFLGSTIERALGEQEVTGARVVPVSSSDANSAQTIECDTICMAYGVVPNVELASVAGCEVEYRESHGGWIPKLGRDMETTQSGIFVVGDGAGVTEAMMASPEEGIAQGQVAARAVARREGSAPEDPSGSESEARRANSAALFPPMQWLNALVAAGGLDVVLCQCEEVTRRDFLEVHPPRYLGSRGWQPKELSAVCEPDGALNQDFLKRMTRVGMGHCQGRRCREHSALLVAHAKGVELSRVLPGSYRVPVRPLSLSVMQAHDESLDDARRWPAWSWLHPVDEQKLLGG